MNVCFLQDNGINESLAMTDVAGLLKSKGHACDVFIKHNERRFLGAIANFNPGLIVVPMDVWGERVALSIAREVKAVIPAPVVFCGTYPMLFPEILEHPEVDIVVRGESEFPILEIAECLEAGKDFSQIQNLVIKVNGEVRNNGMRPLLQDLNALPMPFREIYFKYSFMRGMSMKRFAGGRGCPNACSFCYNAKFREMFRGKGAYVRMKSVERLMDEIEAVRRASRLNSVHFSDDLFTHNRKWVLSFCEQYAARFKGIPFTCNTTVHDVDEEMLAAMKTAGCTGIAIGVETGNERLRFERLNKHYLDEDIIRTAAMIKKQGMFLTAFNMIALPYETIENAFETVRLNRRILADNIRVTFLSPIPRTALVESAVKDGLLAESYEEDGAHIMTPEIKTNNQRAFKTLYALFDIAAASPFLEKIVSKLLWLPIPGLLLFFLLLPRMYREKKFFNIKFLSGLIFYLNTALPQYRTKNFNNFLP